MWGFWVKSFSGGLILKVSDRKSLRFGQSSKRVALRAVLIHVPNKKKARKLTFASILIAFSINSSQLLFSCLRCSIWAVIEGLSSSQNIQIRVDCPGAALAPNSIRIDCKCLRWEEQRAECWMQNIRKEPDKQHVQEAIKWRAEDQNLSRERPAHGWDERHQESGNIWPQMRRVKRKQQQRQLLDFNESASWIVQTLALKNSSLVEYHESASRI